MLNTSVEAALWFLPFAVPIALWVAWSDMKYMKIFNEAVLALLAVYLVIGLIALPFDAYLWRWLNFLVILVAGFVASSLGLLGGGDAKIAAAIAPFVAVSDAGTALYLLAACLLVGYAIHRVARNLGPIRKLTPDWVSWQNKKQYPMGLSLGGFLMTYLGLAAAQG